MARFTCNFISYTLVRTVDITVVIPSVTIPESMSATGALISQATKAEGFAGAATRPQHTRAEKYPVLYLLHGFGNNHATWTGYTNLELYAEERNIAVVMISAENKSYVNQGKLDRFDDFIENELPDFICGMFPVSTRPEDTFIAGLSMGGFGALVHGLSHPEKYAAIGAFSPAVSLNTALLAGLEDQGMPPAQDPLWLAQQLHAAGKPIPTLYLACGEKDFLFASLSAYRTQLMDLGYEPTWVTHPTYGHEWRFWDMQVERFLDWIPRSDAYASAGKRQI